MKIIGELHKGVFLRRVNRFAAMVKINKVETVAYLPNPGRMKELLIPSVEVLLRKVSSNEKRKTNYDMLGVYISTGLVSIDSRLPNALIAEALMNSQLEEFSGYELIRREYTYGSSRFDFLLKSNEKQCLLEVKSCTLVEKGQALFPDARSIRGRRHLLELIKAKKEGYRACVIFVIQREDASAFSPADGIDPQFGDALRLAASEGVEIFAYLCEVTETTIRLKEQVTVIL